MGIRFSNKRLVYRLLACDTSANLRIDLDDALQYVGWVPTSTILGNGKEYSLTSPEGLSALCRIQDTGYTRLGFNCIDITFLTTEGTPRPGFTHHLAYGAYSNFQIVAGVCQMFISVPFNAINTPAHFSSVCGGIPALSPSPAAGSQCAAEVRTNIGYVWWSCSNENQTLSVDHQTFRNSLYCTAFFSVFYATQVYISGGSDGISFLPLRLIALTPTDNVDDYFGTCAQVVQMGLNLPFYIDAVLAFRGDVIGQLWDAFLITKDAPIESIMGSVEGAQHINVSWRSFNRGFTSGYALRNNGGGTYFGTLFLAYDIPDLSSPAGGVPGNYVY